jgi:hypothetical protein
VATAEAPTAIAEAADALFRASRYFSTGDRYHRQHDEKTDVWIDCGHVSGLRDVVP